jgi:hypothetical protein
MDWSSALIALATIVVCAALLIAGALKLRARPVLRALGVLEIALAVGIAAQLPAAQWGAAALLGVFAVHLARELAAGHAGAPCHCFGERSKISRRALARTITLAALAACVALTRTPELTSTGWLTIAVACLAAALILTALVAFTLAREVAALRRPAGALEIEAEGPPLGSFSPLIDRFENAHGDLRVAVFVSPGCAICAELAPALEQLDFPLVVFDEEREPLAWAAANVPGSPYAIALDATGTVLAKGTFNTRSQLESIPATALHRRANGQALVG